VPEREGERRLALVKAAFREVAEKGFAEVTLDDIARRAGVSKGVTLYYFSSKEDLFRRVFAWLVDSIHARMRDAVSSAAAPAEKIHELVAITFPSPSKNRAFFRTFVDFCGLAARRDAFRDVMERFYRGCREIDVEIVRDGVRRGDFAVTDADAAASTMRAIFDGLMMQWLAESDLDGLRAIADWITTYVTQPHEELVGHAGPVCPFLPGSVERKTLWLAPERVGEADVVAAHEAGAAAEVRRLYVLKQLASRQMWAGRVVHDAIEMALHIFREGHDAVAAEHVCLVEAARR